MVICFSGISLMVCAAQTDRVLCANYMHYVLYYILALLAFNRAFQLVNSCEHWVWEVPC